MVADRSPNELASARPPRIDALTCAALAAADPEGDPLELSTTWTRNGAVLTAETGPTLAGVFVGGDVITCTLVAAAGGLESPAVTSAPLTIANSAPTIA